MEKSSKIYVAGHRGLVGSAIWNNLIQKGYTNLLGRTHEELDLMDGAAVARFFAEEQPEYVFLAAAHVGGIVANNTYRADFIYRNLQIQNNVIGESWRSGVKKLLFLGSTCIYPKEAPQPMPEDSLLTGPLEYTNGTNFIAAMPTNLYGPNDNFDLERSHVLPAMVRKMHLAKCLAEQDWLSIRSDLNKRPVENITGADSLDKIVDILRKYGITENQLSLWGTGTPLREFLWSEEMADACVYIMERVDFADLKGPGTEVRNCHINIGTGEEISIRDLAYLIRETIGYKGTISFDAAKPDGTMRKLTDVTKLHSLGWRHAIDIKKGVEMMYAWYLQ
jgi:GDP-L-fucose synthase